MKTWVANFSESLYEIYSDINLSFNTNLCLITDLLIINFSTYLSNYHIRDLFTVDKHATKRIISFDFI